MRRLPKRRKIHQFFRTEPSFDFIKNRLLPAYKVFNFENRAVLEIDEGIKRNIRNLEPEIKEYYGTYYYGQKKEILPITILKHFLQIFGYDVFSKEYYEKNKKKRRYMIEKCGKPFEINSERQIVVFD
jgi:hypothetical protein